MRLLHSGNLVVEVAVAAVASDRIRALCWGGTPPQVRGWSYDAERRAVEDNACEIICHLSAAINKELQTLGVMCENALQTR
jgi:hypothetical protein